MADYQPLDLSSLCNAGLEVLNEKTNAPLGDQLFRGLPFRVNDDPANCFIASDKISGSVTIPINSSATGLILAHRLLESDLMEGGPLGIPVADYVFRIEGGEEVRIPIRERFEIAHISLGGKPFVALPDHGQVKMQRYEGHWSNMGRRQTEVTGDYSKGYFLWAWRNPHPDREIESLEVIPSGPRFIVAGVTVSQANEHPFVRQGKREARLILTDPEDAEKPFDMSVGVDRGVASYVHPLPEASADDFVDDDFAGWGEAQNPKSSPAYVEVAAIPSATVTVKQGEDKVGEVRWGDVEQKKVVETPRMRIELLDRGRNWVHVNVLDDDTGRPVPCRVHFRSPEGIPYQPYGHHNQVNSNLDTWHIDIGGDLRLGQITYAYIDGRCQGWLPRGEVVVDVARGFEYEPLRTRVKIEPGQQELNLRLKRWVNMNAQGWYSGDSHVHFLSTQGSHTESQGEDLNIVNLLPSQWGNLFTNTEDFTGRPSISQDGNNIVYVGQENRQHFLGHLILWGLKEPVMPWCSDGPGEAELGGTLEITMSDWADQCHAQGGSVIIPHLPNPNGEPAALIATGRADGVEMLRHGPFNHIEYYRYLNCGYKLPLVGGTDKMSSDVPVGLYRTYAYMPDQDFTYDNWCKAVSRGRTFHSGGPIIHLTVDGHHVGDTHATVGCRHGGDRSLVGEHLPDTYAGDRPGRPCSGLYGRPQWHAAAGTEGAGTRGRTHLARSPVRGSGLHERTPSRRLGTGYIRPHFAHLHRLRGRVVDVRPGSRTVHAYAHRRRPAVHPTDRGPARTGHRDAPSWRRGSPGLPGASFYRSPGSYPPAHAPAWDSALENSKGVHRRSPK